MDQQVYPRTRVAAESAGAAAGNRLRELRHDIRHELATISLLTSLLADAGDLGPTSQHRAAQLQAETGWLEQLLQAYDEAPLDPERYWAPPAERIRVDGIAAEAVTALRLTSPARLRYAASAAWAYGDPLKLWRALRNLIDNAARAAGPTGTVQVWVGTEDGWTVAQIDDDGPGFDPTGVPAAALGLRIVQDLARELGGGLELGPSRLGGVRARILLPGAAPAREGAGSRARAHL